MDDEQLHASLLTAAEELMRLKLEEEFMKTKAEVESLHSTSKELLDGQEKINDILRGMEDKLKELDEHEESLRTKEGELEEASRQLEEVAAAAEACGPDDVVVVPGGVHSQLVEAYALDTAIDDAIYSLGDALRMGALDCDVYLKKVRNLSRKQFFQRLLMEKCRQRERAPKAGARSISVDM